MQTRSIQIGSEYAWKRGDSHVRFRVTAIQTEKNSSGTTNKIVGYVTDDNTPHKSWTLDPSNLLGPIAEYDELVKRKQEEEAKRKADEEQRQEQALADRRLLYKFVGKDVPRDSKEYHQMFRVSWTAVDISNEGQKALIARIREGFPSLTGEQK